MLKIMMQNRGSVCIYCFCISTELDKLLVSLEMLGFGLHQKRAAPNVMLINVKRRVASNNESKERFWMLIVSLNPLEYQSLGTHLCYRSPRDEHMDTDEFLVSLSNASSEAVYHSDIRVMSKKQSNEVTIVCPQRGFNRRLDRITILRLSSNANANKELGLGSRLKLKIRRIDIDGSPLL